ncbi:uncharacterized protein LOC107849756 [Capsicum annuum]|uniref:uncharacterized protein LOC107849756 n=1 Tax=Capsicum annuum TaxID=4072 RepID=UPI0007BF9B40|nr:uncharacterized protein LOC107849756 [Capsicum annuum]
MVWLQYCSKSTLCMNTYLRTYDNVIEPLTNMEMWPVSSNIAVAPPEITTLLGRQAKNRKKEVGETKKSRKFSRTGLEMTCSVCHVRGHNKRGYPHRAPSTEAEPTTPSVATDTGSGRGRDKPKKTSSEAITEPPQEKKKKRETQRTISMELQKKEWVVAEKTQLHSKGKE